ncbi:hypothetical protein [Yinghuangia seranimata]|uniref:hypothetical protein n=1 Tax=Yinghuangia seranimata TaxID=408067 RepID=UPI00248D2CAC|nr:hypothetical protein [Yinghuangia seranimata]MDI2130136.1 hypothetical protein [Yinghuangia seranimata]
MVTFHVLVVDGHLAPDVTGLHTACAVMVPVPGSWILKAAVAPPLGDVLPAVRSSTPESEAEGTRQVHLRPWSCFGVSVTLTVSPGAAGTVFPLSALVRVTVVADAGV